MTDNSSVEEPFFIIRRTMSRKLVILGGGESGAGAAVLGKIKGYEVFRTSIKRNWPGMISLLKKGSIQRKKYWKQTK
jgi:hypothetical protein